MFAKPRLRLTNSGEWFALAGVMRPVLVGPFNEVDAAYRAAANDRRERIAQNIADPAWKARTA